MMHTHEESIENMTNPQLLEQLCVEFTILGVTREVITDQAKCLFQKCIKSNELW